MDPNDRFRLQKQLSQRKEGKTVKKSTYEEIMKRKKQHSENTDEINEQLDLAANEKREEELCLT